MHGLEAIALRYANVYGPRQNPHGEAGVVAIFSMAILEGRALMVHGNGKQTRDYIHPRRVGADVPLVPREDERVFYIRDFPPLAARCRLCILPCPLISVVPAALCQLPAVHLEPWSGLEYFGKVLTSFLLTSSKVFATNALTQD